MTISPWAGYTKLSPNKTSPRNHQIDTVTIHCTAGESTLEGLGAWFGKTSTAASANYAVDKNGAIGCYVVEEDRSWCSSSRENDNRAITIEVVTEAKAPYKCTSAAIDGLVNLLVDVCKRNGIPKLLWRNDKSLIGQTDKQNMTVHRWFTSTTCPGDYLMGLMPEIANRVNVELTKESERDLYRVQIGAYRVKANAEECLAKARKAGFSDAFIVNG